MMSPAPLPQELYEEIVAYLWDDIPSLKACSLASRMMTLPAQRLSFRAVSLRPTRNLLREESRASEISGTSSDFQRLLARSPHIAGYVRSMHIMETNLQYARSGGDDVLVNDVGGSGEGKESG